MKQSICWLAAWLRRRAENVAAALLATVFVTFILQIAFRYVFGWPVEGGLALGGAEGVVEAREMSVIAERAKTRRVARRMMGLFRSRVALVESMVGCNVPQV